MTAPWPERSSTAEELTLRTLKLRHHKGMLQIIPFSELGPITNFMREPLVVKFNIVLPYGTPVNKVRKIIKKVGKEMAQDERYAADIVKPPKSQGVKDVGDSVMTFRVKFSAKPGKHFVIRREAFRMITEALEAKGYEFAHRKVIVEMPPQPSPAIRGKDGAADGAEEQSASSGAPSMDDMQAAGGAALETILDDEKKKK